MNDKKAVSRQGAKIAKDLGTQHAPEFFILFATQDAREQRSAETQLPLLI
jgi:hypothetical protein